MRWLAAFFFVLFISASDVKAAIYHIDLTQPGGIPGTSGLLFGPCNCSPPGPLSAVYSFQAGDIVDFGTVTILPVEAFTRSSPGAPPQPRVFVSGGVGVSFTNQAPYPDFIVTECQVGTPCNPPSTFVNLLYTIPDGATRIQVGWYGSYNYAPPALTSAVPEPATWALVILGFAGIGGMSYRRRANSVTRSGSV
jgi:hypothetical protein